MKKDLGKSYGEPSLASSKTPEKYYPSTSLENEDGIDIPASMINVDIDAKVTVRIVRKEDVTDKKGKKQRLEIEFRKIDFGKTVKDKDIQDDIADAIENHKESKAEEDTEE